MKRLLFFSVLVLSGFFVNAQGFSFGPKVGANISGLSGLQFKNEYEFGYHIGGFAEIMLSEKIGIQPEVLWSQTVLNPGTSFRNLYPNLNDVTNIKLNYISIPLLLNIKPAKFITFQVGPQFGVLQDKQSSFSSNVQSAFKSGDFSLLAGVQFKILAFRVYGRYALGLTNVNDLPNLSNVPNLPCEESWKSRTLQIGIGLGL